MNEMTAGATGGTWLSRQVSPRSADRNNRAAADCSPTRAQTTPADGASICAEFGRGIGVRTAVGAGVVVAAGVVADGLAATAVGLGEIGASVDAAEHETTRTTSKPVAMRSIDAIVTPSGGNGRGEGRCRGKREPHGALHDKEPGHHEAHREEQHRLGGEDGQQRRRGERGDRPPQPHQG